MVVCDHDQTTDNQAVKFTATSHRNEISVVQCTLLGSILSNILLVLGCSFLYGGAYYQEMEVVRTFPRFYETEAGNCCALGGKGQSKFTGESEAGRRNSRAYHTPSYLLICSRMHSTCTMSHDAKRLQTEVHRIRFSPALPCSPPSTL